MGFKRRATPTRPTSSPSFTRETLQFLVDLEQDNNRDWFNANKARYERAVREPALQFVRQMAPHIAAVSEHFEASDKRVGGSLMRIYRDTRFARDKTPYKTNIGIHFRHRGDKNVHGPGLYVHIAPGECFIGVGSWRPASDSLAGIRRRIAQQPAEWAAARDDKQFRAFYELSGESLQRMPRGFDDAAPHPDDLRRKDHLAVTELTIGDVLSPGLVEFCAERFLAATSYVRFLSRAVSAPF